MKVVRRLLLTLIIAAVLIPAQYIVSAAGSIAYGAATVAASALNVRSGPDTSYDVVDTIPYSSRVVILEKTSADWYYINYRGTTGYIACMYLTDVLTAENFDAAGKLNADDVIVRDGPSTSEPMLSTCSTGETVDIIGINNGWYKVVTDGITGYIRSDFIDIYNDGTSDVYLQETAVLSAETSLRDQIATYVQQFVGYPYVYGGETPSGGFDCSGLVQYVYRQFDIDIMRTARAQYANDGTKVSKADLQPGDLVFFSSNGGYSITHVGMYIGNGQFCHASTPRVGVIISDLNSAYYTSVWYGAVSIV